MYSSCNQNSHDFSLKVIVLVGQSFPTNQSIHIWLPFIICIHYHHHRANHKAADRNLPVRSSVITGPNQIPDLCSSGLMHLEHSHRPLVCADGTWIPRLACIGRLCWFASSNEILHLKPTMVHSLHTELCRVLRGSNYIQVPWLLPNTKPELVFSSLIINHF